jgi:uncharacterized protein YicC (UPF0701 family)
MMAIRFKRNYRIHHCKPYGDTFEIRLQRKIKKVLTFRGVMMMDQKEDKAKTILKELFRCAKHKITLKRVLKELIEEGRKLDFIVTTLAGANRNKQ